MPPRVSRLLFESDVVTILSLTKTDDSHWHLLNAVVYNRYLTPEQVTSVLVYLTSGTLDDYRVGLTTEYLLQTSLERNILGEVLTEPLESFEVLNSLTKVRQSAVKSDSFEGSCVPGPWLLRTLTGLETKPDATCNLLDHVERVYHQEILALLPVKTENLYHVNACETCQCSPFARKAVEATSSYGLSHYAGWAQDVAVELLNEACGGNLTFWVVATSRVADGGHDPLGELLGGIEGAVKPSPKSGS
jgi:hypothetical protein